MTPDPRPICRAPHTSLNLDPLGAVRACCMSPWYVLGRVGESRLPKIWAGAQADELRRRLDAGDLSAGCDACRGPIEAGRRDASFARTFDDLPLAALDDGLGWPSQLELALSNTCNLQCTMCNGTLSSAIRSGRERLPPLASPYDDQFFADLVPFLRHVERISFLGGEPFLARETWRVVELLRAEGLRPRLQVTTNGTIWNERVERLLADFPVDVVVSVDAVEPETMRAIRIGVSPEEVWQNLDRLQAGAGAGGGSTAIAHCLMVSNWREFPALLERADRRGLDVFVNEVTWPISHALAALPSTELRAIIADLEAAGRTRPLGRNQRVFATTVAALGEAGDRAAVPVQIGTRPDGSSRSTAEFVVDDRQTLVQVSPDPADVFGVDLTGILGHPVGEWMEHFQAVHGHLERSSVARTEGGREHWTLEVRGTSGRPEQLEAEFIPAADGGGTWRLVLSRT